MTNNDQSNPWGDKQTEFFYQLTPHVILDEIEKHTDFICTGRALALNSMENRVYEVEIENPEAKTRSENFIIAKFYRPGRWSKEQILEEHQFTKDLIDNEIPAVGPLSFNDGSTLQEVTEGGIYFTLFPKKSGRSPSELSFEEYQRVGRLLGRMHAVGKSKTAPNRISINEKTYGLHHLDFLQKSKTIPFHLETPFLEIAQKICNNANSQLQKLTYHRIHGDCHFGNLIHGSEGLFWVDFDDMLNGPAVQDLWLIMPGTHKNFPREWDALLKGYETMNSFDEASLRTSEIFRALRLIHFAGWIAKRWKDPAFPRAFPQFDSDRYWTELTIDLTTQHRLIEASKDVNGNF